MIVRIARRVGHIHENPITQEMGILGLEKHPLFEEKQESRFLWKNTPFLLEIPDEPCPAMYCGIGGLGIYLDRQMLFWLNLHLYIIA